MRAGNGMKLNESLICLMKWSWRGNGAGEFSSSAVVFFFWLWVMSAERHRQQAKEGDEHSRSTNSQIHLSFLIYSIILFNKNQPNASIKFNESIMKWLMKLNWWAVRLVVCCWWVASSSFLLLVMAAGPLPQPNSTPRINQFFPFRCLCFQSIQPQAKAGNQSMN